MPNAPWADVQIVAITQTIAVVGDSSRAATTHPIYAIFDYDAGEWLTHRCKYRESGSDRSYRRDWRWWSPDALDRREFSMLCDAEAAFNKAKYRKKEFACA